MIQFTVDIEFAGQPAEVLDAQNDLRTIINEAKDVLAEEVGALIFMVSADSTITGMLAEAEFSVSCQD